MALKGRVQVSVLEARSISQLGVFCSLSAVSYGGSASSTSELVTAVSAANPPRWEESFSLTVADPFADFQVLVSQAQPGAPSRVLGKVSVPLWMLSNKAQSESWYKIESDSAGSTAKGAGELLLRLQYNYIPDWNVIYKAMNQLYEKRFDESLMAFGQALTAFPEFEPMILSYRSLAFLALDRVQAARTDAETIIHSYPNHPEGYYRKGLVMARLEDEDAAEKLFQHALTLQPRDPAAIQRALSAIGTKTPAELAVKDLRRGRDCYIRGQYSEASKHFASAIKHNTSNFTSHLCHALAEIALKQPKNAAADALKLSQLLPAWPKEDVVKEGWLKKESGHGIYKTRWFSLKACFLYYFKKDKDFEPLGVIPIHEFVCSVKRTAANKVSIVLPERTYILRSSDKRHLDAWEQALKFTTEKPLLLPNETLITTLMPALSERDSKRASMRIGDSLRDKLCGDGGVKATIRQGIGRVPVVGGLENVLEFGYLWRAGKSKEFRFFLLKAEALYFFEQRPTGKGELMALGSIPMTKGCAFRILERDPADGKYRFQLTTPSKVYVLSADTADEMMKWKAAIQQLQLGSASVLDITRGGSTVGSSSSAAAAGYQEQTQSSSSSRLPPNNQLQEVGGDRFATSYSDVSESDFDLASNTNSSMVYDNDDDDDNNDQDNGDNDEDERIARSGSAERDELTHQERNPSYSGLQVESELDFADLSSSAGRRTSIREMSSTESKYFQRFGLEPPSSTSRPASIDMPRPNSAGRPLPRQESERLLSPPSAPAPAADDGCCVIL